MTTGGPQFPDTPEGRRARRELGEWVRANQGPDAPYQRELLVRIDTLREERRVLTEQINHERHERQVLLEMMQAQTEVQRMISATFTELMALLRNNGTVEPAQTTLSDYQREVEALPRGKFEIIVWNQWDTFRAATIHAYTEVANQPGHLGKYVRKDDLKDQVDGASAKTLGRGMDHYALPRAVWPPDLWPLHDPRSTLGQQELLSVRERFPDLFRGHSSGHVQG